MGSDSSKPKFELNITVSTESSTINYINMLMGNTKTSFEPNFFKKTRYSHTIHESLKWQFDIFEKPLSDAQIEIIFSYIYSLYKEKYKDKNVLLCIVDKIITPQSRKLLEKFSTVSDKFHPFIFFITHEPNIPSVSDLYRNSSIKFDRRNVYFFQYHENDVLEVYLALLKACSYYNELGDEFTFPTPKSEESNKSENSNTKKNVNSNLSSRFTVKEGETEVCLIDKSVERLGTINFLVTGRPGVGKSTFINLSLGEKRTREGRGQCVTSKIVKYFHNKYPISFYDSPGFNTKDDVQNAYSLINDCQKNLVQGKNQLHLIFFLINCDTSRTLLEDDVTFIKEIKKLKVPIYFLVTRCKTELIGEQFKDLLKMNLKAKFPENNEYQELQENIFTLQLLEENRNEKEIRVVPFGLGKLYQELYNRFSPNSIDVERLQNLDPKDDEAIRQVVKHSLFFKYLTDLDSAISFAQKLSAGIVTSYSVLAAAICASPIPFSDWFLLTPIQIAMTVSIAAAYGRYRNKEDALQIVKSMTVNLALSGVGRGVASILKFIPVVGTIAGTILGSAIGGSFTAAMGYACMKIFEQEVRDNGALEIFITLSKCYNSAIQGLFEISKDFYQKEKDDKEYYTLQTETP